MTPEDHLADHAFLKARDEVSDEELEARINAAPDMGGAMLVALNAFVASR